MAGYDTANYIYASDVQSGVKQFGTPAFFVRYFNPCPDGSFNSSSSNANSEAAAAWDDGGPRIGAVSSPPGGNLGSNSSAEGHADAQTFGGSLQTAYTDVGPMLLPSNGTLYCWLDDEYGTTLSSGYWTGWAEAINGWNWQRGGSYPLFAGLYCNPKQPQPNCSTVGNVGYCYGIWTSNPQCNGGTVSNPPAFNGTGCGNSVPTKLWQFAYPGCGYGPDVDMDEGATGVNYGNYCFYLTARP